MSSVHSFQGNRAGQPKEKGCMGPNRAEKSKSIYNNDVMKLLFHMIM